MTGSAAQQLSTAVQSEATAALPVAVGLIAAVGVVAFGIKGVFIAWRAGSKAIGKA